MASFDGYGLLDHIPSYWRDYYANKDQVVRFWEAMLGVLDDDWANLEQLNDASTVDKCPTFTYHTYVHRELENWKSYGLPHLHNHVEFISAAGQTDFYLGTWPDPKNAQIFVDGKEIDMVSDPFILTLEEDPTQPSINPSGGRLIFDSPRALNSNIGVFTDRELYYQELEVPAGGLPSVVFPAVIDSTSVRVVLKKVKMYGQPGTVNTLALDTTDPLETIVSWHKADPTVTDTRIFYAGERFEIRDGVTMESILIQSDCDSFAISPVTPATTVIYKSLDLDITDGQIAMSGYILRASGQSFPVGTRVRVTDEYGSESELTTEVVDAIEFTRSFGISEVFAYGSKIIDAYTSNDNELTFFRSFNEGIVVLVEAAYYVNNDHAEYHEIIAAPTNKVSVPTTRPFALTAGLIENPFFPVQLFVNGILMHPDKYTFLSTTTIELIAPLVFATGTDVSIYYVDQEDIVPHKHVEDRFAVKVPANAFELSDIFSDRFTQYVSVDGVLVANTALRWFTPDGLFLNFDYRIPTGGIVKARGARQSFSYYHDIDTELIRAAYLQDGIDQKTSTIPAGWETQLAWGVGFTINDGLLESDAIIENAWFKDAYVDDETGYNNYGKLIGFYRETSDEYMRILRALFAGSYMGSQPQTVENFVNIILGSQYLDKQRTIESIDGLTVNTVGASYSLDPRVPERVEASKTYERFYAVSDFAQIIDDWESFDLLPIMAEQFSPDYGFAKTLDNHVLKIRDGLACEYNRKTQQIEDSNQDFYDWEVWIGDLIAVYPTSAPLVPIYGRVTSVSRNSLGVVLNLGNTTTAYGQGWFGQYTYGGATIYDQIDSYKIWARETSRIDTYEFLDQARSEEVEYLSTRFTDLLGPFVFLVKMRWVDFDGQALDDVAAFLNRSKPHDTQYLGYTEVYDDSGLADSLEGDVVDNGPAREIIADFLFVSDSQDYGGRVGEDGQIAPNVGSFIGVEII